MKQILKVAVPILLLALLVAGFFLAVEKTEEAAAAEGRLQLEQALRRSAVACYAAEGIYPPTLEYLTEHYGVQIDTDRYRVYYEIFAENLMPSITVLEKSHEK